MNWFQNPWVVGIGGGVISGLVVFFLTKWLFSNQSKRELGRKIDGANHEILLAVRQGIPENTVPANEVLDALTKATARKHGLRAEELYGPGEVAQDLIKEVMDSSFISAETKENYCKRLAELDKAAETAETSDEHADALRWSKFRSSQTLYTSFALALSAAAMSATMALFANRLNGDHFNLKAPALLLVALPVAATSLAAVATLFIATLERQRRRRQLGNMILLSAKEHTAISAANREQIRSSQIPE